jgi:peptidoglycan hydrolase-like amidase
VSRGYRADIDADVTNGSNGVVILYDLTVDTDAQASSTVTNTAVLTNYAGDEGAFDHTAEDKSDTASIVIDSPEFTKVLTGTEITGSAMPVPWLGRKANGSHTHTTAVKTTMPIRTRSPRSVLFTRPPPLVQSHLFNPP